MTDPTRQEIIDAHEAADNLAKLAAHPMSFATDAEVAHDYRETILAALPPKPRPTMNDIKWDDNEHFLAEAEHPDWGKVAMLRESGLIIFVQPIEKKIGDIQVARVEEITPTGKRYTLTEVQE